MRNLSRVRFYLTVYSRADYRRPVTGNFFRMPSNSRPTPVGGPLIGFSG